MVFERFLQETSTPGSNGLHLPSENTSCESVGLFSSISLSKRQSLDECQREFACQIDRLTIGRSLNAMFVVKLCLRAVCDTCPLGTSALFENEAYFLPSSETAGI